MRKQRLRGGSSPKDTLLSGGGPIQAAGLHTPPTAIPWAGPGPQCPLAPYTLGLPLQEFSRLRWTSDQVCPRNRGGRGQITGLSWPKAGNQGQPGQGDGAPDLMVPGPGPPPKPPALLRPCPFLAYSRQETGPATLGPRRNSLRAEAARRRRGRVPSPCRLVRGLSTHWHGGRSRSQSGARALVLSQ